MNTFDYITLQAFYRETCGFLGNSRIVKIQQPSKSELVLTVKNASATKKLYLNINPQTYHICFINDDSIKLRDIKIPKNPPMFCMLLRKYIDRCKIIRTNIPPNERIFELYIETYNELNEKIILCLAIELMGKYSNIILYNTKNNVIIGCAHNVGEDKSQYRELKSGLVYEYPPKQNKKNILNIDSLLTYENLNRDFIGFSEWFQVLLKNNSVQLPQIKKYFELKAKIKPVILNNQFSIYSELLPNGNIQDSVNGMIDNYYSKIQEETLIKSLKSKLTNHFMPTSKKIKDKLKTIDYELKKENKPVIYKKYGDLLYSNLYDKKYEYTDFITITDWEENKEIKINLDKELSLKENAQKYYKLYNKSKTKLEYQKQIKEQLLLEKNNIDEILYEIESAKTLDILKGIETKYYNKNLTGKIFFSNNIKELTINNYKIYIGKNNKQNDYIVSKLASSNDYWFHIKDNTGSHILLKNKNNKTPDKKTIYECCKLAKEYSSAKTDKKAAVIYTQRKYIKKPPKSNLGYVIYKNEKEIIVSD